ncbi:MAG: LptF/LptG family permease [Bacteroidales bacterium]|nr:LptF/LptG family permease [Bacteroidales bacterium]
MKIVKKLDIFILKQFALLFAGTFFICLFIFMMQFLWRWVDELIGKGLSLDILGRFFFYATMTLVPMSLPLAILLASLISFGNMGERLELLAMKSAGIPLVRILRPVFIFVIMVSFGSFYFQNVVSPESSKQLAALIYSMRQKSPELEIPEGVFYNEIPGYNLFVEQKDPEKGMLYGIMIYNQGSSFDDTQVVLADSGRLQSTADQMHLQLTLYDGQRFRNMQNTGSAMDRTTVPYMRETFKEEIDLIPFDNTLNLTDASLFDNNAKTKNLSQLTRGVDSLRQSLDSIGRDQFEQYRYGFLAHTRLNGRKDSASLRARVARHPLNIDSINQQATDDLRGQVTRSALSRAQSGEAQTSMMQDYSSHNNRILREHSLERHKKFTLSLACIIFFFIGAPLGAIIRKGGLGVPVVVSVIIFILYYIVNASGEKLAKSGAWDATFGAWLSTMVLAPIGGWLTWKSNQDSAVFNFEGYQRFFRRLLGLRLHRNISRKEIIMEDPDYPRLLPELRQFSNDCAAYVQAHHLRFMPNYFRVFFHYEPDIVVMGLCDRLEAFILELSNSRDARIIATLNDMPIMAPDAHTRPFRNARRNAIVGVFFPVGIVLWIRIWRYRLRLWHDLEQLQKQAKYICQRIEKEGLA